jgi:hypothetical protein
MLKGTIDWAEREKRASQATAPSMPIEFVSQRPAHRLLVQGRIALQWRSRQLRRRRSAGLTTTFARIPALAAKTPKQRTMWRLGEVLRTMAKTGCLGPRASDPGQRPDSRPAATQGSCSTEARGPGSEGPGNPRWFRFRRMRACQAEESLTRTAREALSRRRTPMGTPCVLYAEVRVKVLACRLGSRIVAQSRTAPWLPLNHLRECR